MIPIVSLLEATIYDYWAWVYIFVPNSFVLVSLFVYVLNRVLIIVYLF